MSIEKKKFKTMNGKPIFGATIDSEGVNFGIFTRNGKVVVIELYENYIDDTPVFSYKLDQLRNKTGDVWHVYIKNVKHGMFYGWRVDGEYNPDNGNRFNFNKLLIDPYAKAFSGSYNFNDTSLYGYNKLDKDEKSSDLTFSEKKSSDSGVKSIVIDNSLYNWEDDIHPRHSMQNTIIYEMNVRLFTMNINSNVEHRGTFKGITEKIEHLKDLGITAIELMPVFEFNIDANIEVNPLTNEKLKNVWGYNPLGFFAVTGNYTCGLKLGEQVFKFNDFVKFMHLNGIEVLLDVVYNHSGEGNEMGPTISFRGLDNSIYYLLESYDKRYYSNYAGTGNTINCSHSVVKQMIIDSLRYWVTEMHVDGFRFDLAAILGRDSKGNWIGDLSLLKDIADDPVLSGSKLIAEGWDAAGGYFVGEFPTGWAEWNGKYRDTVRKFVRGDDGTVGDLATRISGSPDLFQKIGRKPYDSVNFITAHDGFTMWDLVSYNEKHNFANGEENRDGMNENYSYNCGEEGKTLDKDIIDLRKQKIKNFITILMLSQGVPMIYMGDEFCRTQNGNNNAYNQDNISNWVDWSLKKKNNDVFRFFKNIIKFRKEHVSLRRRHFFTGNDYSGDGVADITWHGTSLNNPDFSGSSHSLAFMISGDDFYASKKISDNDIYVALNSYHESLEFQLPKLISKKWYRVVDTAKKSPEDFLVNPILCEENYILKPNSIIVLISK